MKNKSLLFSKVFMMFFLMAFTFMSNASGLKGVKGIESSINVMQILWE